MGKKNREHYVKDLNQQAYYKLSKMIAFGESKRAAKAAGIDGEKIFSIQTFKTYRKHIRYFTDYVKEAHPECTQLKKARAYVPEWLQLREAQGLSAWTVQTEAKALGKLFGIKPEDEDYYDPPVRRREDIVRSRGEKEKDKHFSKANNEELIRFCRGTGLRRSELEALRGNDLVHRSQIERVITELEEMDRDAAMEKHLEALKDARLFEAEYYTHVRSGKGGRERYSPIVGRDAWMIVERIKETPPKERVWKQVHSGADIHSYRADYATRIYNSVARPIEEIPYDRVNQGSGKMYQSEVYCGKGELRGTRYDRSALLVVSKALGHNRLTVVPAHYLRPSM